MERLVLIDSQRREQSARRFRNRVLRVLVRKALAEFRRWREQRRETWRRAAASRELRHLSDRMLRDIGLQRSDLHLMR